MGYMHDELHDITDHEVKLANGEHLKRPGRFHRFFQYLSLFCFSMLGLLVAGNIAMVFVFWELVGVCSYFLIGFYVERKSASTAANKAFIVNRVGDFGFALGICGVFFVFQSISFQEVFEAVPRFVGTDIEFLGYQFDTLTLLTLLLFVGAMGKSAQIGLHTWLPDAMEGPTPVSALIHAATMVTAGVFMVARLSPMFEYAPSALAVVAAAGYVNSNRMRVLAVTSAKRLAILPAIPTVVESGVPQHEFNSWVGVVAPVSTPAPVIKILNEHMARAARSPEIVDRLTKDGAEVVASSPEQFKKVISEEVAQWAKVIKAAGIKAD